MAKKKENLSLVVFDPMKAMNADIEKKDAAQEFDHTTPEGEKALRSWVQRIRGHKSDIERARKTAKADALAYGRKVDDLARELTLVPQRIIDERMKPLNDIKAAEQAAADAEYKAKQKAEAEAEAARLADLEEREAAVREAEKKEADKKAEQERKVREKNIAKEAAAKAKREAEEKAAKEKRDAKAEEDRLAKIEADRVADKQHRQEVENAAAMALIAAFGPDFVGHDVVTVIKEGHIPNITINY